MNENEQRIAIAEFCGWTDVFDFGPCHDKYGRSGLWGTDPVSKVSCPVPDYLHDLNAMHEAEEHLHGREQLEAWNDNFYVTPRNLTSDDIGDWPGHSNAAQRAEALLRTIGKWKEPK